MAASAMRFFFALLTFVTVGMIIGALIQLAFIKRLEDSHGAKSSLTRIRSQIGGITYWDDKEAAILRLGYKMQGILCSDLDKCLRGATGKNNISGFSGWLSFYSLLKLAAESLTQVGCANR